jgi:Cft2 family RNA processing exonuclease
VPLSDHADFSQLINYVKRCKPRKIYTLHGEAKFAKLLREMGYDAEYMHKDFRSDQATARKVDLKQHKAALGENYELF